VFTFFSAGIGGPHAYEGRGMVEAHKKMMSMKPISEVAFHALSYHVLKSMEEFKSGGSEERDTVLGILYSLKGDVMHGKKEEELEEAVGSLWERMGEEEVIKPMVSDIYDLHASDPLTAPWFGPDKEWNTRETDDKVKELVFTFFSAGIGGPHEYEGRDMITAHQNMRDMKPITETAFHALSYHVMTSMEKHNAGGEREREEVLGILYSLKNHVVLGRAEVSKEVEEKKTTE